MSNPISVSGGFRTGPEANEASRLKDVFQSSAYPFETQIENFPKYIKRQNLTRLISLYDIFKEVINVKGSVIECGVNHGFGLMTWAKLSSILEPINLTRRVYGFDTFSGFPTLAPEDQSNSSSHVRTGDLCADVYDELTKLIDIYDSSRPLGHIPKVSLIKGDACQTIPDFISENPHLVVSLLFLDFDLYEPTKAALECFVPRMPRGAIIAFDELDNPLWPGETQAMLEYFKDSPLELKRHPYDPYISFAQIN